MKKLYIVLIILCTIFLLGGCGSSQSSSVEELKTQAQNYATQGNLDDAIEVYSKILNIKEDPVLRGELNDIKKEKESVHITKEFINTLNEVNKKIPSGNHIESADMQNLFIEINNKMDKFESIDITIKSAISDYIINLKSIPEYSSLKRTVTTAVTIPNGNNIALGLAIPLGRNNLQEQIPDLLAVKFPEKYGTVQ